MKNDLLPRGSAVLSPCGTWRYRLDRDLGQDGPTVAVIGVNPSTADADTDDATIRKVMGFGRRLGWGSLIMVNKFAYRSPDVRALRRAADPIGPQTDVHLQWIMYPADIVIAAWGPLAKLPPALRNRWRTVAATAEIGGVKLQCWGVATDGHPRHPLMLAYETPLVPWAAPPSRAH